VQLQYVQLITDQTTAADRSSAVFAVLLNVTPTIKIQNPLPFSFVKNYKQ